MSEYTINGPPAREVLLAVEVAYSSLDFDMDEKADLYARAGVVDYWVVDIENRRVLIFREPVDGAYTSIAGYGEGETVAPLTRPEAAVSVGELLPPLVIVQA